MPALCGTDLLGTYVFKHGYNFAIFPESYIGEFHGGISAFILEIDSCAFFEKDADYVHETVVCRAHKGRSAVGIFDVDAFAFFYERFDELDVGA